MKFEINKIVYDALEGTYIAVRNVLIKRAGELCDRGVYRNDKLVSMEEIYARLKLAVIFALSGECQNWTEDEYCGFDEPI